jgi:hypothetical protein
MGEGLAEWMITGPGGRRMLLQISYFDRSRDPVTMDIGPVLDLDDVIAGKIVALASRAAERDYVDAAVANGERITLAMTFASDVRLRR